MTSSGVGWDRGTTFTQFIDQYVRVIFAAMAEKRQRHTRHDSPEDIEYRKRYDRRHRERSRSPHQRYVYGAHYLEPLVSAKICQGTDLLGALVQ